MATEAWEAIVVAVARALESEHRTTNPQNKKNLEEYLVSMRGSVKGMFEQGRLFQGLFNVTQTVNTAVQGPAIDAIHSIKPLPSKSIQPPGETA